MGIRLLTPQQRRRLKAPIGILIEGSFTHTMMRLKELIHQERPSMLISVGDVVSKNMTREGIQPTVLIVDNKVMRREILPIQVQVDRTLSVKNPAGTLTDETWEVVEQAIKLEGVTRVLVEGEEDLLTLVAVLIAPEDSLVVYGQPRKGIVVVRVTEQKKKQLRQIVEAMREKA